MLNLVPHCFGPFQPVFQIPKAFPAFLDLLAYDSLSRSVFLFPDFRKPAWTSPARSYAPIPSVQPDSDHLVPACQASCASPSAEQMGMLISCIRLEKHWALFEAEFGSIYGLEVEKNICRSCSGSCCEFEPHLCFIPSMEQDIRILLLSPTNIFYLTLCLFPSIS